MRSILCLLLVAIVAAPAVAQEDWSGKTVVITGANRGLGLEFARQLHEAGADVIATARRPEAATELNALGVRVEQLDVTDPESVAALKAAIGDDPVDVLLNNAGIFPSRAGIESAWHGLNNGVSLRVGIGKSRREAGERAQLADEIKIWNNNPVMVFDVADGVYAYYIPSEFTRAVSEFIQEKYFQVAVIFFLVFVATFIGWNVGQWELGLVAIVLAMLYAIVS